MHRHIKRHANVPDELRMTLVVSAGANNKLLGARMPVSFSPEMEQTKNIPALPLR
jgi:hypothetical protein